MNLTLPREVARAIVEHTRDEDPHECCGIIGGRAGELESVYPVRNGVSAHHAGGLYEMVPEDQFRTFLEMDERGEELVAIYHSHPNIAPVPSMIDVEQALTNWPDPVYLICSLGYDRQPPPQVTEIRGWRMDESHPDLVREVGLEWGE